MGSRPISLFLVFGLILGMLAAAIPTGVAHASPISESRVSFPWIPSGAELNHPGGFGSSGPYYGSITIQNLESEEIVLYYKATSEGDFGPLTDFHSTLVGPYGARTFTPQQLQISDDVDGSGAVFVGRKSADTIQPARISGVQKQAAAVPIDVDATTHGGHLIVGGYTGLRGFSLGPVVQFPIVQTNSNWNTVIRATNLEPYEATAQITLTLREAGTGNELSFDSPVTSGGTVTFDLLELGVPQGWIGSARISSDELVSAVAERFKNETGMLIMNTAEHPWQGGTIQYLPLVLRDWFDWNTGISLLNLVEDPNQVTVTFYANTGDLIHTEVIDLPPGGMDFLYLPAGAGGDEPFVGSAIVESDDRVMGAIDKVKYIGDPSAGAGHALSHMLESDLAMPGQWLSMPLYQKGNPGTGLGDTSGVQLFNPSNTTVTYGYNFFDQSGNLIPNPAGPAPTLGPKESVTIYAMNAGQLPESFTGTMIVGVLSGGSLIGISNNVNYEVQQDGSASFNMMVTGEPDELPGPPGDLITP